MADDPMEGFIFAFFTWSEKRVVLTESLHRLLPGNDFGGCGCRSARSSNERLHPSSPAAQFSCDSNRDPFGSGLRL